MTWRAGNWQILLATLLDARLIQYRGFKLRVDDVSRKICQALLDGVIPPAPNGGDGGGGSGSGGGGASMLPGLAHSLGGAAGGAGGIAAIAVAAQQHLAAVAAADPEAGGGGGEYPILTAAAPKSSGIINLSDSDGEDDDVQAEDQAATRVQPSQQVKNPGSNSVVTRVGDVSAIYPSPPIAGGAVGGEAAAIAGGTAAEDGSHDGGTAGKSSSKANTVSVRSRDLLTLEDTEFLNDNVIDFFIKRLQHERMPVGTDG